MRYSEYNANEYLATRAPARVAIVRPLTFWQWLRSLFH